MKSRFFGAYNNSDNIRTSSSSGGVFAALAETVLSNNGVVYGALMHYDKSGEAECKHYECTSFSDLHRLQSSKYLPSNTEGVFEKVKNSLTQNKTVLFCGTPCQTAALKCFLYKDYDNLYTVDFICHGVPSPKLLKKVVKENNMSGEICVNFRDKANGWDKYAFVLRDENGNEYKKQGNKSVYMRLFLTDMYLKPSCYNCQYKGVERNNSDITLGDFWGVEKYWGIDDSVLFGGISVVICQNEKGMKLFEQSNPRLTTKELDEHIFDTDNIYIKRCANKPFDINKFRKMFFVATSNEILKRYEKNASIRSFIGKVRKKLNELGVFCYKAQKNELPGRSGCYGCMACKDICPFNAIETTKDEFGFIYPHINKDLCRKCKMCISVCPRINEIK